MGWVRTRDPPPPQLDPGSTIDLKPGEEFSLRLFFLLVGGGGLLVGTRVSYWPAAEQVFLFLLIRGSWPALHQFFCLIGDIMGKFLLLWLQ
jgi:hypothetical protein